MTWTYSPWQTVYFTHHLIYTVLHVPSGGGMKKLNMNLAISPSLSVTVSKRVWLPAPSWPTTGLFSGAARSGGMYTVHVTMHVIRGQ